MSCPRCGSRNIVIVSSDVLEFKCKDCGHRWTYNTKIGYVQTPSGQVHWTEVTYYRELAIEDAKDMIKVGKKLDEIVQQLEERYGKILTREELVKIVEKARKLLEISY